jgi:hypothetical protein
MRVFFEDSAIASTRFDSVALVPIPFRPNRADILMSPGLKGHFAVPATFAAERSRIEAQVFQDESRVAVLPRSRSRRKTELDQRSVSRTPTQERRSESWSRACQPGTTCGVPTS